MRYLSLFSGIEAATQAWEPLGWDCVAVSEIEPGPCKVLTHHYPNVPNLGDVRKIGLCARYDPMFIAGIASRYPRSRLANLYITLANTMVFLGHIDIVVFGSPCQDLSVAGKRKGFTHDDGQLTRSGLFHIAIDIVRWARGRGCRFALWENVPGAFTSNAGRDFAAVVGQMAGLDAVDVPPKGWGTEGCAVGTEAMVEWSTLDAQWFGVAQRRRRVFALADFGDWAGRRPILLEPQGLRGDSAPRREAWQGLAAGALRSTDGGSDVDHAAAGHLVPVDGDGRILLNGMWWDGGQVSQTLDAVLYKGQTMPEKNRFPAVLVPQVISYRTAGDGAVYEEGDCAAPLTTGTDLSASIIAYSSTGAGYWNEGIGPLRARPQDSHENLVTYQWRVRRLTPRECERLQGMVDDFTMVPVGRKMMMDGPRYKMIGNSMARVVMEWIGRSINGAVLEQQFF